MAHANAALTPRARLKLARLIVERRLADRAGRGAVPGVLADREAVGGSLPRARRGRHGRPVQPPAPDAAADPAAGGAQDRAPALEAAPRASWRSPPGSGSRPPRCTGCCAAAGSAGSTRSTGPPGNRCAATNTPIPGSLIHVDVKKLGNIPDGGGWRFVGRAARARKQPGRDPGQAPQPPPQPEDGHRVRAHRASTTTPGSPTPRSTTTRPPPPPSACCAARWPGSPPAASSSSGSCPTTAPPTAPTPGATPAPNSAITPEADPALPAPDQRQDRTLPPHPGRRLGLPPPLPQRDRNAERPCPAGSTSTTTTGPTPPSAGDPRSPD